MTEKRRRRRRSPEQDALDHIAKEEDKAFIEERYINNYKGRGVFATQYIEPKSFVVEYRGVLSLSNCPEDKNDKFIFDFMWNGKQHCIDASKEDGTLGRLVNDDHINPNCTVKRMLVHGRPHLCLFATKAIFPGDEITYNYGDSSWPWRSIMPCEELRDPRKIPESELEQEKTPCEEISDLKVPDNEPPQEKTPCEEISDLKVPDNEPPQEKTPCEEISDLKVPDNEPPQEKEVLDWSDPGTTGVNPKVGTAKDGTCHHTIVSATLGALNDCEDCRGPVSSFQWLGFSCKLCSRSWHKSCFLKNVSSKDVTRPSEYVSDTEDSDGASDVYIPSASNDGSSSELDTDLENEDAPSGIMPHPYVGPAKSLSSLGKRKKDNVQTMSTTTAQPFSSTSAIQKDSLCSSGLDTDLENEDAPSGIMPHPYVGPAKSFSSLGKRKKDNVQTMSTTTAQPFSSTSAIQKDSLCSSGLDTDLENEDAPSGIMPHPYVGPAKSFSPLGKRKKGNVQTLSTTTAQPSSSTSAIQKDSLCSSGLDTDLENEDAPSGIMPHPYVGPAKSFSSLGKRKKDNVQTLSTTAAQPSSSTSAIQKESLCTLKNYCYVCKEPQSKISRHFKKHEKEDLDIAQAFSFPKNSKERKNLLEKLRNKGNFEHNQEVMNSTSGSLKVKRRPGQSKVPLDSKMYVHCTYCKGMFVRKELWRHTQRCPSKTKTEDSGRSRVLSLADIAQSTCSQPISPGVWKVLGKMREDDVGSVVRNDFIILQLAQSLYNKHGNDSTKFEYIRTKVREMGRLLLTLRKMHSLRSFEDALKANNFYKIVSGVKTVAGYNEENHSYSTPSLALKLGHSLRKIGDIILCRAIASEDENLIKAAERFIKLCSKEWAGQVSHTALATLSKSKFNKPSIIPFTEDVQKLHKYLDEESASAIDYLKKRVSSQAYGDLARVTLAKIILFNRRRAGEVSKMSLESFQHRDQTELHSDVAASLSPFEQKLARHFSRVEIMGKRGRKVAVLLNPDAVYATTLLTEKREICSVHKDNPFLFGRPKCPPTSYYRGQDCVRTFAYSCGAKNPQNLRSTQLRKHVATQSQILNLKNNELDQLANFMGHDIRVHRDFYRLPEATIEVAKITKILLAMEKGNLAEFQGKSLEEIEIEDELDIEIDEGEQDDEDSDMVDSTVTDGALEGEGESGRNVKENSDNEDGSNGESGCSLGLMENDEMNIDEEPTNSPESLGSPGQKKKSATETKATSSTGMKRRKCVKRTWSKSEISAVMKHFKTHIEERKLASKMECQQCQVAEHPVLKDRSLQNIRDFVRNRGLKGSSED